MQRVPLGAKRKALFKLFKALFKGFKGFKGFFRGFFPCQKGAKASDSVLQSAFNLTVRPAGVSRDMIRPFEPKGGSLDCSALDLVPHCSMVSQKDCESAYIVYRGAPFNHPFRWINQNCFELVENVWKLNLDMPRWTKNLHRKWLQMPLGSRLMATFAPWHSDEVRWKLRCAANTSRALSENICEASFWAQIPSNDFK